jgi:hypothetical protein
MSVVSKAFTSDSISARDKIDRTNGAKTCIFNPDRFSVSTGKSFHGNTLSGSVTRDRALFPTGLPPTGYSGRNESLLVSVWHAVTSIWHYFDKSQASWRAEQEAPCAQKCGPIVENADWALHQGNQNKCIGESTT